MAQISITKPFVVIDENEATVQRCIQKGYLALQGNAASDDVLREAGIQYAKTLLVATDQDANNMFTDGTMILAIKKPSGLVMGSRLETRIESGDAAMIVGTPEQLSAFVRKYK